MPKSLQEFYENIDMKNNVHEYLVEFLKAEAVRKLMNKEEVTGVAEAKEYIDKAFENLEVLFNPQVKGKEPINEAR